MQKIEMISFINFSITLSLGSTRSLGHRDAEDNGMFCQHFQYFHQFHREIEIIYNKI